MKNGAYSDKNLEEFLHKYFGVNFTIKEVVSRDLPLGRSIDAFVFKSQKGRLYAFISAEARLTLADIKKLLTRMNVKPAFFFPPNGYKDYFTDAARRQFLEIFPARTHIYDDELRFYKTRVIYNPALIEIGEVIDGQIKAFNADSADLWRVAVRLSYKKIIAKS